MLSTASMRSSDTRIPRVQAASVKEWPAPTAFTVRPASAARLTMAATSSGERGLRISLGDAHLVTGPVPERRGAAERGGHRGHQ